MIITSYIENLPGLFGMKLDKLDAEIAGVNLPLFEAADSVAAVLTEFRPTVHDPIDVGDEAFVFYEFDELVDHATRLQNERGMASQLDDATPGPAHRDGSSDLWATAVLEKSS